MFFAKGSEKILKASWQGKIFKLHDLVTQRYLTIPIRFRSQLVIYRKRKLNKYFGIAEILLIQTFIDYITERKSLKNLIKTNVSFYVTYIGWTWIRGRPNDWTNDDPIFPRFNLNA